MRNRKTLNGLETTVITGTYGALISICIKDNSVNKKNFLGFEILREDLTEKERYPLKGFKYFPQSAKKLAEGQLFDTDKHPVQSFYWEDFTVKPEHDYIYSVIPIYGKPLNLEYGKGCAVPISSEKAYGAKHSVFFNRGVAGSIAYARRFENRRPDEMSEKERKEALTWLSRGLEEALIGFIEKAITNKWGIRAAFYEFTYLPVLEALQRAVQKGCDVQIVYDSRKEAEENDESIKDAGLKRSIKKGQKTIKILFRRTKDPQVPSHNKFMVLMDGTGPAEVWTGSTNITDKGIFGHSNVGHIVRDRSVAKQYFKYWESLHLDPEEADLENSVQEIQKDILKPDDFSADVTVFFSPRTKKDILKTYAAFIDGADDLVCGIFPFSFSKDMKAAISQKKDFLRYILVDKINNAEGIIKKDGNTVIVNGAFFDVQIFDWLTEINAGILLNKTPNASIGTNYVHNKILLINPLSKTPVIIVGSANFSDASVASNDENTMVIKAGPDLRRISDIYFTEFYRMFHHFFVRKATKEINKDKDTSPQAKNNPLHLCTDNSWVAQFRGDKVKVKMQDILTMMPLDY